MTGHEATEKQRAALTAVLDALIPASDDGRFPGAGALGLADTIERDVPELQPLVSRALDELDEIARANGAADFVSLDAAARAEALRTHVEREPGFLPGLVFQVYTRYYTEARVLEALGLEARPPFPKGYDLEQPDLEALLAPVRTGPRRYREA
jgi:hypothetical protein